jgi:hypothetical protein
MMTAPNLSIAPVTDLQFHIEVREYLTQIFTSR